MHAVQARITYQYLKEALALPEEARIVNVDSDWGGVPETIIVYIEHPGYEELGEDCHALPAKLP